MIGIGGTGLSAIAKVLLEQGYSVSGSDQSFSELAEAVQAAGAEVYVGHAADQIRGADLVIRSSAVPLENVEVQAAIERGTPVFTRREFLARLMKEDLVIAVAGSHGKTTTTSMLVWILSKLKQDPSFIVGGIVENLGTNAAAGEGNIFVIEADEYDYMFWGLNPDIEVITNVEHDHPDLFPTAEDFRHAFREFIRKLSPDGWLILCGDDPGARQLLEQQPDHRRTLTYGLTGQNLDFQAVNLSLNELGGYSFDLISQIESDQKPLAVSLQVSGKHNVYNAAAALIVAGQLNLPLKESALALTEFKGSGRRFEVLGEFNGVILIDDYAHHPTEIKTTLEAARGRFPGRNIWAVWEPHTYSRIQTFAADFRSVFAEVDHVLVTKIYPAREEKPSGFSIRQVVEQIKHQGVEYIPEFDQVVAHLAAQLTAGDVVIVLSAGEAIKINQHLMERLENKSG